MAARKETTSQRTLPYFFKQVDRADLKLDIEGPFKWPQPVPTAPKVEPPTASPLVQTPAGLQVPTDQPPTAKLSSNRIITNFKLGESPYTQLTIGLCGLDPEIRFNRNEQKSFDLSVYEFRNLDGLQQSCSLSLKVVDGGHLSTSYRILPDGGIMFEKRLDPFSCPMDFGECTLQKFELSCFEALELKNQLNHAEFVLDRLISGRPVFETMYTVILKVLDDTREAMSGGIESVDSVFPEVYRRFRLYTSKAYLVRLFLERKPDSMFSLYNIIDVCATQYKYLNEQFE